MLSGNEHRTFHETHKWIDFHLDVSRVPYQLWMLVGEARSKCDHLAGVPLSPERAKQLYEIYLSMGVHATTSIEGNTLTEEQVRKLLAGSLKLPASQKYLENEVQNVIDGCNEIAKEVMDNAVVPLSRERICHFNALVLRNLDPGEEVVPGQIRTREVGVLRYRGAPWKDCEFLVDQLSRWLNTGFVSDDPEMKFALALFKAVMAHLFIAWIHPFGDGNGRTARLLEFQILIQSGVPLPAAHLLSNHYNKTRTRYYAELDRSSKAADGVTSFLQYAIQGFVDGLREQIDVIRSHQIDVTWENHVHDEFRGKETGAQRRQKHLVLAMTEQQTPRNALLDLSPQISREYASKGDKTLSRDLNALIEMGLVVRKGKGYAANKDRVLAFLPPRVREPQAPREEDLA